jgi:hypothetical protein
MTVRWQFMEGYEGDSSHWSWRVVSADGSLENQSPPFSTYGLAVSDALKRGFQPRQQHWIVMTRHTVTHFRPGQPPLSVPLSEEKSPPLYRARMPMPQRTASRESSESPPKIDPTPSLPRGRRT